MGKKKDKQVIALADARKRKGWSQRELAARLGVTHSSIGNYEAGIREPSLSLLKQMAQLLDVPMDELVQK